MKLYSNSNKTAQEEGVSMAISRALWRRRRKGARQARILREKTETFMHCSETHHYALEQGVGRRGNQE